MPVIYQCQRCTACCQWPGQVRLPDTELSCIAAFLHRSEFDFIQQYTRLRHDRKGLALQEKPNGECIFLQGFDCLIQPVKPQQCRDFPNGWRFPGFDKTCRAIPLNIAQEDQEDPHVGAPTEPTGS